MSTGKTYSTKYLQDSKNNRGSEGQILSSTSSGIDWVTLSEISGVDGTGTANYLSKWLDANTITNSLVYDDGTNVGIGTTNPADKLEVEDGNIRIETTTNTDAKLILNPYSSALGTTYQWELVGRNSTNNYNFQIRENGNPYLTIENSVNGNTGNVGIGTVSPTWKLEVDGTSKISPSANQPALYLARVGGQPSIKASTTDGYMIIDSSSNYLSLNHYVNKNVALGYGGGNVGIGTVSPLGKLQVTLPAYTNEDTNSQQAIFGVDSGYGVRVGYNETDNKGYINVLQPAVAWGDLVLQSDGGNVGIGTTAPNAPLSVKVSSGATEAKVFELIANDDRVLSILQPDNAQGNDPWTFATNNSYTFRVDSIDALNIDSAGKVGIGTTSPNFKLEVVGDSTSGILAVRNAANARDTFRSENAAGTRTFNIGNDASGHGIILIRNSGGTTTNYITGSGNSYFNAGNVGIGTTSPAHKLHIASGTTNVGIQTISTDAGAYMGFEDNTTGNTGSNSNVLIGANGNNLVAFTNATERLRIDSSGNVGIGTTSPSYKLSVSGGHFGVTNGNKVYIGGAIGDSVIGYLGNTSGKFTLNSDGNRDVIIGSGTVTDAVFIKGTNGNVGIGITSPNAKLDIVSTGAGSEGLRIDGASGGFAFVVKAGSDYTTHIRAGATIGTNYFTAPPTNGLIVEGNVGIRTTNPKGKLHVLDGTAGSYTPDSEADTVVIESSVVGGISLIGTGGGSAQKQKLVFGTTGDTTGAVVMHDPNNSVMSVGTTTASNYLKFLTGNSTEAMRLAANGNVGIGTTNPSQKLDVAGTVKATSYFLGSSSEISLATTGAGSVFLRPNGQSTSGQMQLASTGNATFAGDVTLTDGILTVNDGNNYVKISEGSNSIGQIELKDGNPVFLQGWGSEFKIAIGTYNNHALSIATNKNATFAGDVTVSGGDITLGGTGRIQGIDTVTASTDAANKAYVDAQVGSADTLQEVTDNGNTTTNSITMTNSLTIDGQGSSSDVLKLKGSARIQMENASATDSFYISNTGGSGASKLDLGGAVSIIEGGNVGIGTASPATKLHVGSGSGATVDAAYQIVADSSGIAGIQILASASQSSRVVFGDSADNNIGMIKYDHANNAMSFNTSATEKVRITSSGNVGIGTDSPDYQLDIENSSHATVRIHGGANSSASLRLQNDAQHFDVNLQTNDKFAIYDHTAGTQPFTILPTSGRVGIGTTSPSSDTLIEINGNSYTRGKTRGIATNYATSEGWVASTAVSSGIGYFGGNFSSNGGSSENKIEYDIGPFGARELVWKTIPETDNNDDGGWNKSMDGFNNSAANGFISVVYVKRSSSTSAGTFYHGCSGSSTNNLGGTANTNPYFHSTAISTLPENVWCVAIGVIYAANDSNTATSSLGGIYRLDTGVKISGATTYRQKPSNTQQQQRVYHYYSTSPTAKLDFAKPAWYVVDGSEPTLSELTAGASGGDDVYWTANGNDIYNDNTGNVGIGTTNPSQKLDVNGNVNISNGGILFQQAYGINLGVSGYDIVMPTATRIAIKTSAAERLTILNNGNVGIGITSPLAKLHIDESTNDVDAIKITNTPGGAGAVQGKVHIGMSHFGGTNPSIRITAEENSNADYRGNLAFSTRVTNSDVLPTEKMRITYDGNVGIGTTSPSAPLTVKGTDVGATDNIAVQNSSGTKTFSVSNNGQVNIGGSQKLVTSDASIELRNNATGLMAIKSASNYGITIGDNGGETMRINTSTDRVGIGTTNPAKTLDIVGEIRTSGRATFNEYVNTSLVFSSTDLHLAYGGGTTGIFIKGSGALAGNVGIGITSPSTELHVAGDIRVGGSTSLLDMDGGAKIVGQYYGNGGAELTFLRMYNNSDASINMGTKHSLGYISFAAGSGAYTERMRIKNNGNVGIGTTNPVQKLQVNGSVYSAGGEFYVNDNSGITAVGNLIFKGHNGSSYFEGMRLTSSGNVGIGITSPSYKLEVNGGILAGGKVTYEKAAGSLDTTGYAVAGLVTGSNGNSSGFTFTCFGNTGDYQRVVYSCYNAAGTWNTQKVIDEGTNDFDVTASANGTTITFTFKSRSGTKNYTPRVLVEAVGHSINTTYA